MPRKKHKPIPPCPDSVRYTLVELEDRYIYRLKRGLGKEAKVNSALQGQADNIKVASPAAKRVNAALLPYTDDLNRGNLHGRISGGLLRGFKEYGYPALRALKGIECQKDKKDALGKFLLAGYKLERNEEQGMLILRVFGANGKVVAKRGALVDSWKITMLTLSGNTMEDGELDGAATNSGITSIKDKVYELVLTLPVPLEEDYLVALRVDCCEFEELGIHSGLRSMAIIG